MLCCDYFRTKCQLTIATEPATDTTSHGSVINQKVIRDINKSLANAKRPCGCSVLCLCLKSSLRTCPYGPHYGRIVFRYLLWLRRHKWKSVALANFLGVSSKQCRPFRRRHLLPTIWPIFVEFHSASSEIRRRKKEKICGTM